MANAAGGRFHSSVIYGHRGTISFGRGTLTLTPEVLTPGSFDQREKPAPKVFEVPDPPDLHVVHTNNFFSCMRTRKAPNLPADLGYQIMTAIRLGVDSYREGRILLLDPKAQKLVKKMPKRPEWEGDGQNHQA